jgi:hypothetical protein
MSSVEESVLQKGKTTPTPLTRNRDYLLLIAGQSVSAAGSQVSQFTFPLLVLLLTGSPGWAGLASALVALPFFFLCLPAGVLVDRWDRRRVMILCDVGRALCLSSIPVALFLGRLTLIQLCACALVEGTLFSFFDIAVSSSIPSVVDTQQIGWAAAQESQMRQGAFIVGPLLGGILFGIGRALPTLTDALTYLVSILTLAFIRKPFQRERSGGPAGLWVQVLQGMRWLWTNRLIRFFALLACVGNMFDNSLWLIFVVVAVHLRAPAWAIGTGFGVVSVAGFLASIVAMFFLRRFPLRPIVLISQWTSVLLLPGILLVPNFVTLGALTAAMCFASGMQATFTYSYRQALVPDEVMGRATSLFRLVAYGGTPLALWATGALLQVAGLGTTILALFAVVLLMAGLSTVNTQLRRAGQRAASQRA